MSGRKVVRYSPNSERVTSSIAPKLDQLFRSALDALQVVEDLRKRGVSLHLLDLGGDISGNGLSKLFLAIAAAFAEAERDRIRERIGQVKADQKARGRYLGGIVPFGYRCGEQGQLAPHKAEQSAIRQMIALRAQGKALRAIAEAMQAKGFKISHEGVDPCSDLPPRLWSGGDGVIDMELLSVIRRWHYREHISIREIARRTGLSRNTIRKYLRSDSVEPKFKVPERPSKLDPFAEKLSEWLRTEAGKSRKQKRTAQQLHADLVALGYDGSYDRVAAFARDWQAARQREQQTTGRGVFVPLAFQPGEAFQFDWSEDWAIIGGERTKLQVAHIKLSHSRAFCCAPTCCRPTRCCSTPRTRPSACWVACRAAASTTTCGPPSTGSARARSGRSTRASRPWPATTCSRPSSVIRPRVGRRVRSRKTCRMPGTGSGSPCRASPTWPRSTPGWRRAASSAWERDSRTGSCPAASPTLAPRRRST